MTNQPEPLTSGVPLYPFSHATLFSKEATSQNEVPAPIPGVRSFEIDSALVPHHAHHPQQQLEPIVSATAVAAQMSELLPGPHQQHSSHPHGHGHGHGQAHAGDMMGAWSAPRAAAAPANGVGAAAGAGVNMSTNMNVNESHTIAHMHAHAHPRPAILSGTSYGGGF